MDTNSNNQQPISTNDVNYLDWLIDQKFADRLEDITPVVRDEFRKDLVVQIDNFVMAELLTKLSDEEVKHVEQLLKEGKTRDEILTFASVHINTFSDVVADVLLEFQTIYLGE